MEKKMDPTKWQRLLAYLRTALSYRSRPGCTTCLTPIMDENGRPVVPHCSRQKEE